MKGLVVMETCQAYELLKHFPMGIKLLFVYNLKEWQKTQNNDLMSTITPQLNLPISMNQSIQHRHQNNIDKISIIYV